MSRPLRRDERADVGVLEAVLAAMLVAGTVLLASAASPAPPADRHQPALQLLADRALLDGLEVTLPPGDCGTHGAVQPTEWVGLALGGGTCAQRVGERLQARLRDVLPPGSSFRLSVANGVGAIPLACSTDPCPQPRPGQTLHASVYPRTQQSVMHGVYDFQPGDALPSFFEGAILCVLAPVPANAGEGGSRHHPDGRSWAYHWITRGPGIPAHAAE